MGAEVSVEQFQEQLNAEGPAARWSLGRRMTFRLCFVYLGLFCLSQQILGGLFPIPKVDLPDLARLWPTRQIVFWAAARVFHVTQPLVYKDSGSGDKTFDWVLAFCLLVFAIAATCVWSLLDRRRENYVTLYKWFRLFIRFALATELFLYGLDKVIPLQMPFPPLTRLLEPFHDFSPMGVLWYSIGASRSYEIFAGCAEVLGGVLLIFPRTTMLGALVALADMTQVFMLNMTYDVPVKLFSFHLLLLSVFLLAPDLERLMDFFFRNRTVAPSTQGELFHTRRANRIALAAQIFLGLWVIGNNVYGGWDGWHTYGGGHPKSALYGIWDVAEMSIDGQLRSPLVTDYDRWHRAVFDAANQAAFQRMDDTFARYGATINGGEKSIALTKANDKDWKANFTFQRVAENELILDGSMDGHKMHMQLQLVDLKKFVLMSRGFHWIQEYPFNR
jgi:hypothetical protein